MNEKLQSFQQYFIFPRQTLVLKDFFFKFLMIYDLS